jgi:hypothetical protein
MHQLLGARNSCLQASRKKVSRTRKNMLTSYAGHDHRLLTESREGLIQAPSIQVRNLD